MEIEVADSLHARVREAVKREARTDGQVSYSARNDLKFFKRGSGVAFTAPNILSFG